MRSAAVQHLATDELPMPDAIIPELAYVLACARDLAWATHANVVGIRYLERRDAHARLRGALATYDRARRAGPATDA